jgi:SnoaL-like domain
MSAAPRKLSAEDRLDIQDCFARYAWGIDLADKDLALSAFAEDAWFDHLWQGRVQGHEAILKNLEELWYNRQHWWYGRQHLFNHFLMTPVTTDTGEEGARVRSFFQIMQFNVEYRTNFVFGIGTRDDVCVKRDDTWLFLQLRVNAWVSRETVPWQGELRLTPAPGAPPPRQAQAAE